MFFLSSNFLPKMSNNSKTFLSNFNYTLKGMECSFTFLRDLDGHSKLFLFTMIGPFFLILIQLVLVSIQYTIKYIRQRLAGRIEMKSIQEEEFLLPKKEYNLMKEYKSVCLSTVLYVLYMVYYGISIQIIGNLSCAEVNIVSWKNLSIFLGFVHWNKLYGRFSLAHLFWF